MENGFILHYVVSLERRERNDWSFEDHKRTVAELKDFFFKTFYHWTTTFDLNISNFHAFLDLFYSVR